MTVSQPRGLSTHLTRSDYVSIPEVLGDAHRVLTDLDEAAVNGQDIEFLTRRARRLVAACLKAVSES